MNVTLERPSEASVPTLDVPSSASARPTNVGIRLTPTRAPQPLKHPFRPTMFKKPSAALPAMTPPSTSNQPPRDVIQTFSDFANPMKVRVGPPSRGSDGSDRSSYQSSDRGDGGNDDSDNEDGDDEDEEMHNGSDEDLAGDYPARSDDGPLSDDPLRPGEGFKTLDDEKTDILCKLNRLKRQGMTGMRRFGVHSDIREMRSELNRIKSEIEMESSIKFQRKILMALTSTMEFANKRWNPLDLELNGWSEQVCESITDYDQVFERLHEKYKGKMGRIPPEAELLLMVGSSAFVFHLTNTMFKNKNLMDNPEFMAKMAQAMAEQATKQGVTVPPPPPPPPSEKPEEREPEMAREYTRPEIRGPGMDFSSFLGGALPPIGFGPPMPQQAAATTTKKRPAVAPPLESLSDEGSDRLSDIISEDLASVPDDLSTDDGSKDDRVVSIPMGKKTTKKSKAPPPPKKTVVMI
jgi:hypothetical protein